MAKFTRILSLDGGGLRGLIPAKILVDVEQKLQQKTGNPNARIADYFDLVAGTSAGGILACLYLSPNLNNPTQPLLSAEEVLQFYYKKADQIFAKSFWHTFMNFWGLLNEKYSHRSFEKMMENFFGNLKLGQLLKPCLITAYDIERRRTHFFTQHDACINEQNNYLVRDVIRSTTAAPTFFEVAQIRSLGNENYTFVDGGVFANNPALCAYAEVRNHDKFKQGSESNPTAKDMVFLSLGTGEVKKGYPYKNAKNWGKLAWLIPLFDIIMTGVAETVDYQMKKIYESIEKQNQLNSQYLRISPVLPTKEMLPIDDTSDKNLREILQLGQEQAKKYQKELDDFVDLLLLE